MNSPEFQQSFLALEFADLKQAAAAMRRIRELDWDTLYEYPGLKWESVDHLRGPAGEKVYTFQLSQRMRATAYRDGEFLRILTLHPDHDSAYKR